jgi:hypothetical protein
VHAGRARARGTASGAAVWRSGAEEGERRKGEKGGGGKRKEKEKGGKEKEKEKGRKGKEKEKERKLGKRKGKGKERKEGKRVTCAGDIHGGDCGWSAMRARRSHAA